jgi:hypothetical protein
MAVATYLYCVARSGRKPPAARAPAGLPGGTQPVAVPFGGSLWLIVSDVPLDRYAGAPLDATLRDIDAVAKLAVAHEAVVEHFTRLRGTTVVPMKLFTMFSSEARAVAEMKQRRAEIEAVLDRIAGCEEWGVRVTRGAAASRVPVQAKPASGAAFLAARKQVRDSARAAVAEAASAAAAAFDQLSPLAADARRRDDLPAGAVPPLLDAAFLVPSARREKFRSAARSAARACAAAGAQMTLTGPWPAYNFVQPPGERA